MRRMRRVSNVSVGVKSEDLVSNQTSSSYIANIFLIFLYPVSTRLTLANNRTPNTSNLSLLKIIQTSQRIYSFQGYDKKDKFTRSFALFET